MVTSTPRPFIFILIQYPCRRCRCEIYLFPKLRRTNVARVSPSLNNNQCCTVQLTLLIHKYEEGYCWHCCHNLQSSYSRQFAIQFNPNAPWTVVDSSDRFIRRLFLLWEDWSENRSDRYVQKRPRSTSDVIEDDSRQANDCWPFGAMLLWLSHHSPDIRLFISSVGRFEVRIEVTGTYRRDQDRRVTWWKTTVDKRMIADLLEPCCCDCRTTHQTVDCPLSISDFQEGYGSEWVESCNLMCVNESLATRNVVLPTKDERCGVGL
jgi:hypothetical protein